MKNKRTSKVTILLILILSLGAAAFSPMQDAEPETGALSVRITQVDTSEFPRVQVYVSVTDSGGEPVAVSPSSLVILENGQEMDPEEISGAGETEPMTTMLVMDVSGSMNHAGKLTAAQEAAKAYIAQNRPQDYIGILAFNTRTDYVQPLTSSRENQIEAVDSLTADDDTAMYDALAHSIELLEVVQGRKAIIALTDGLDNRSKISPQELIQLIGPAGLSISTIGLGNPEHDKTALTSLDEEALSALAELAGGTYGYADDPESLKALYELYGRALQSEYVIVYTSPSQLRDGLNRSLEVIVVDESGVQSAAAPVSGETGTEDPAWYNPGGLVPEVAEQASWTVFAILLAGLLLLLLIPTLIFFLVRAFRGGGQSRVKVKKTGSGSKHSRVKLKG